MTADELIDMDATTPAALAALWHVARAITCVPLRRHAHQI
jgi:hypothetical protein